MAIETRYFHAELRVSEVDADNKQLGDGALAFGNLSMNPDDVKRAMLAGAAADGCARDIILALLHMVARPAAVEKLGRDFADMRANANHD